MIHYDYFYYFIIRLGLRIWASLDEFGSRSLGAFRTPVTTWPNNTENKILMLQPLASTTQTR
jgi:hypothetical protein